MANLLMILDYCEEQKRRREMGEQKEQIINYPAPKPRKTNREELDNWFSYHAPVGDQTERYQKIRDKCKELAELILDTTPECADQTAALRKLRELNMAINNVIACNEHEL